MIHRYTVVRDTLHRLATLPRLRCSSRFMLPAGWDSLVWPVSLLASRRGPGGWTRPQLLLPTRPVRILIIRLGAFGDLVHTLPLAADLHQAGHEVHWLCEERWASVLRGSPALTAVHVLPKALLKRTLPMAQLFTQWRRRIATLRALRVDVVIDAQGLAKSALLAGLSGAQLRIGHAQPRAREGSWLISQRRTPAVADHVIDQQRALGLPLVRASGPWRFPLPAWTDERAWAAAWCSSRALVRPWALNVGAGWPTKVWPVPRQVEFLRAANRPVLVLWGSPAERAVAEELTAQVPTAVLAPPSSIPQLAGLIAQAAVLVSGDTGPLHLALALGVPSVGLFGPVPATRNGPRGRHHRTFQAPGAAWERRDVRRVDMGAITAGDVVAAAAAIARC